MRTLIGLFQDVDEAKATISDLQKIGTDAKEISVVAPLGTPHLGAGMPLATMEVPGLGRVAACGPMTTYLNQVTARQSPDAIIAALVQMGVPNREAKRYVDGVRNGGMLETVRVADDKAGEALEIMRAHAKGNGAPRTAPSKKTSGEDTVIPIIVEELVVGKREVGGGGIRATSRVEETPVEEEVTLRQERVDIERRPVDRPVGAEEDPFRDRSVEVVATSEQPIITKRARVIEEVIIRKNIGSTTQTVRDTVRRTDIDVEPFDASEYRGHYEANYGPPAAPTGEDFSTYQPAYKFGSELRTDTRFAGNEWPEVERDAEKAWEDKNPGTWERFKDAVHHAWERAKRG